MHDIKVLKAIMAKPIKIAGVRPVLDGRMWHVSTSVFHFLLLNTMRFWIPF
jgi:hypothetical protein